MQGKRQIINSSFLSLLWNKIFNYLKWKIKIKRCCQVAKYAQHNKFYLFILEIKTIIKDAKK